MTPEATIAVMAILLALVILFTAARFTILRNHSRTPLSIATDVFCLGTLLCAVIMIALLIYRIRLLVGVTDAAEQTALAYSSAGLLAQFVASIFYTTALWTVKAAFLCFFGGLFYKVTGIKKILFQAAIVYTVAAFCVAEFGNLAWCRPIQNNWAPDPQVYAKCAPAGSATWVLVAALVNIINDVIVLCVPISILPTLQIGRKEKVALAFVLIVGVLSVAAAITRIAIVHRGLVTNNVSQSTSLSIQLWSVAEVAVGAIAFTLPSFRILLVTIQKGRNSNPSKMLSSSKNGASRLPSHAKSRDLFEMKNTSQVYLNEVHSESASGHQPV